MGKTITTMTTRNLYTWQQIVGPEKIYIALQAVKKHFQEKQEARKNITKIGSDCKLHYCLTHDYKMMYVLLGRVHWACNNHPYPLCKCNYGDGAIANENHKCEMISDDDYLIYWKKSVKYTANLEDSSSKKNKKCILYKLKQKVYDWIATNNFGVTHYGCSQKEFPLSEV